MRIEWKIGFLCLLYLMYSQPVVAGGWPQPKGGYFIKLSEWWMVSDQHFDGYGDVRSNTHEFGYYTTSLYMEYGISGRLTGIINFPFLNYVYALPPSQVGKLSAWSTGDVDAGLKWALLNSNQPILSLSAMLGIPTGKGRGDLSAGLQTGQGEFTETLLFDAGTGFKLGNNTGWLSLTGGYKIRSGGYSDEFLFGVEGGLNVSDNKISLLARLAGIKSGDTDRPTNPQSLFSNNRQYLSFSPEIIYHFDKSWGMTAGVGTAFSGKNIFASPTFSVGVFRKRGG